MNLMLLFYHVMWVLGYTIIKTIGLGVIVKLP